MLLWVWMVALMVGLVLGLFGAGGGMLSVPLLIYGVGLPIKEAVVMSIWLVAVVSLVAALHQRVWRVLRLKLLAFFAFGGILGGALGARLAGGIPDILQQFLFVLLLIGVSLWMLRVKNRDTAEPDAPCNCLLTLLVGILVGGLTGILGVGAGFLMVPILIAMGVSHLPTAVAHSLVLIACNATAAGISYIGVVSVELNILVLFIILAATGALLGGLLLKRLPMAKVQGGFTVFLLLIALFMLFDLASVFFIAE